MGTYSGVTLVLFSIWIMKFLAQGSFSVKDLTIQECRIAGITLISHPKKLNFSEAESACRQLGLQLASKTQVENARNHGFETCSFGWVADKWLVISRVIPNPKCGQNKIGVADWKVPLNRKFHGFCFNSSDIWIDSCIPETGTTLLSATDPEVNSSSTASSQGITEMLTATESPKPQIPRKTFRIKCVTETILQTVQTTLESEEEIAVPDGNRAAFTNDSVVFGGVPIALLVLALTFFMASAVLAVCYIRKYKRTCPFSDKKPQKERIEAKVIKDAKSIDSAPEKESKNNGKKAEEPQTKPEATVKCVEAEV
ncbi:lymphatic vessel endothelial hyaluronic acid receptor 1 [Gopherus flavomarginatus]|uniref:lymphatic vessel endothelial hyaluronic acid receptor 1 n=1 Tax=Gopherus flavomarginatus TaxID=286002 RepID=UPI0021CB9C73|nr:lymphatic vessel endothelial hyaluronic acid receptor 1 [Gopherus flavomarginatus]